MPLGGLKRVRRGRGGRWGFAQSGSREGRRGGGWGGFLGRIHKQLYKHYQPNPQGEVSAPPISKQKPTKGLSTVGTTSTARATARKKQETKKNKVKKLRTSADKVSRYVK